MEQMNSLTNIASNKKSSSVYKSKQNNSSNIEKNKKFASKINQKKNTPKGKINQKKNTPKGKINQKKNTPKGKINKKSSKKSSGSYSPDKSSNNNQSQPNQGISINSKKFNNNANSNVKASSSNQEVSKANKIKMLVETIGKYVKQLKVSKSGKISATMSGEKIPAAFNGANITINKSSAGYVISIDNFPNAKAVSDAVNMIKANISSIVNNAQNASNVQIARLSVGNNEIVIPKPSTQDNENKGGNKGKGKKNNQQSQNNKK